MNAIWYGLFKIISAGSGDIVKTIICYVIR